MIEPAAPEDAMEILALQRLAYLSEAKIYGDYSIPPLTQTLDEMLSEFGPKVILKATEQGKIIGSVRGYIDGDAVHLERLIVHPAYERRGVGSSLIAHFEECFPTARRFELFTGHKSERNLSLYAKLGYKPFRRKEVHPELELVYMERVVD